MDGGVGDRVPSIGNFKGKGFYRNSRAVVDLFCTSPKVHEGLIIVGLIISLISNL